MVVLRFSTMIGKVRSGQKKQTIRPAKFYKHLEVGDEVQCWSTKKTATSRRPILNKRLYVGRVYHIMLLPWRLIRKDADLAKRDGFKNAKEMRDWFENLYPRIGDNDLFRVIRWH